MSIDQNKHSDGCPSCEEQQFTKEADGVGTANKERIGKSSLTQWPVQLTLVAPTAPYFQNADLVLAADCVPFAYADFHTDFLDGKALAIGCPKLDDIEFYAEKITQIITASNLKSIQVLFMEVPCCYGIVHAAEHAISASGKDIPLIKTQIGVRGDLKE
ncbi:MAG: hypothetical protein V3W19_11730 [Desulfatiglandales bacterium]